MRFYHGTSAELHPGDRLAPGVALGRDNYGLGENEDVYVTTALGMAVVFAMAAYQEAGGDVFVYEVHPDLPLVPSGLNGEDFMCSGATIVREIQPEGAFDVAEETFTKE